MEPQPQVTKQEEVHRAKWLILSSCSYSTPNPPPQPRTPHTGWEYVTRTTKLGIYPDGASLIPILKYPDGSQKLCLIANHRPPVGKYMLEFPAGLLDPNETVETAARRELLEETGYTLTGIRDTSFGQAIFIDPWKSNESDLWYVAEVDMSLEANKHPKQA